MSAHKIPNIGKSPSLTEAFIKPANFFGTQREYNETVLGIAKDYPYGIDGDSARSFQPGGPYDGVRMEDVRKAISTLASGPK